MALAHNGMIRGLNSIYLQATHIPREDLKAIRDFMTYCQCWCESMHHHHDMEEQKFFPSIERIAGVDGLMQRNVEQHRAFTPGFDKFQAYVRTCAPKDYDRQKLKDLIDDFAEPLTLHLREEIDTLRGLDKYDSKRVREAYEQLEKSLMATDNVRLTEFVTMSTNITDSDTVPYRTTCLRNRRSRLRRRHTQLSSCAILCAIYHQLHLRNAIPRRLAFQSMHDLERS